MRLSRVNIYGYQKVMTETSGLNHLNNYPVCYHLFLEEVGASH